MPIKKYVSKINFKLCPRIRKRVTYCNIADVGGVVAIALWRQFGLDLNKPGNDKYYVGDFSMTESAKAEFEAYYKPFFKSKFFKGVALDYTMNVEPKIVEEVHGPVSKKN